MELLILCHREGQKLRQVQEGSGKAVLNRRLKGNQGCLRADPKLRCGCGFVPSQGQNLASGDLSDALKHEQSVTISGEILPLPSRMKKQKPWGWKVPARDPESGTGPRPLAPAPCPFHCARLLCAWNQPAGPLVTNRLGDSSSL